MVAACISWSAGQVTKPETREGWGVSSSPETSFKDGIFIYVCNDEQTTFEGSRMRGTLSYVDGVQVFVLFWSSGGWRRLTHVSRGHALTQSTSVNVSLLQTHSQKHPGCCPTKYHGPGKLMGKIAIVQEVQTSDSWYFGPESLCVYLSGSLYLGCFHLAGTNRLAPFLSTQKTEPYITVVPSLQVNFLSCSNIYNNIFLWE